MASCSNVNFDDPKVPVVLRVKRKRTELPADVLGESMFVCAAGK